jgi:hypothetical protein
MGRGESRADIILDYYKHCGLETIGPAQLETSSVKRFSTFEGLIDELIKTATFVNIVVNHGDFANGLLIKFCPESNLTSTSKVIGALSELADRVQNGTFNPADPGTAIFMKKVTSNAQISQPIVMRIVSKLIVLRTKPRIVHLRACRMEFASIVMQYKTAFRALAMSFHGTRIIFQRIDPLIPRNGKPVATIVSESGPNTAERRLRKFEDSLGEFATMMIGVGVLLNEDGDVIKQDSVQLIDRRDQVDLTGWAELLVRRWKGPLQKGFVIPIMWADKDETTYHCPLETGWRQKIQTI